MSLNVCFCFCAEERERQMPQRSGLRERRNADSSRLTQPTVTETWVSEEQLDLAEIKQFLERCRLFSLAFLQFAGHHIYLSKDTSSVADSPQHFQFVNACLFLIITPSG